MPPPKESPELRTISYLKPSGRTRSSLSEGSMALKKDGLPPALTPVGVDSPFWDSCFAEPCSSLSAQPVNTPALPAANAAEPVPRKVRNRRRPIPLGAGSTGRLRFSLLTRLTLGPSAIRCPFADHLLH